ncbi:MAG TPA: hypothetical protein VMK12_22600 [Anaeromyxobacteraceae bacterium]|nr:hypothetical protein [Anaeromyxobacteraceae bacterium]
MADEIDLKLVDKRVAHRYLRKNRLDQKDYEKYLKALPDRAEQALPVESALEGDDLDEPEEAADAGAPETEPTQPPGS